MKPTIVIISGLAGSGKTVALRTLEDKGFYCVDNIPVTLLEPLTSIITDNSRNIKVGLGIDIREKEFLSAFDSVMAKLREKYNIEIIFLESEKDTLIRRFKETRRPHPLSALGISLEDAIDTEKTMLLPLRKEADRIIDTSALNPHQLRHLISDLFVPASQNTALAITLISFGYKFGVPQNIDLLFDVRFIPNPQFVPALKDFTGADKSIQEFVFEKTSTKVFLEKAAALLNFLIPQYIGEGKSYLTIAFGCTGGKHRSPAVVEKIASLIKDNPVEINIVHRDIQL